MLEIWFYRNDDTKIFQAFTCIRCQFKPHANLSRRICKYSQKIFVFFLSWKQILPILYIKQFELK